jgi:hypothetical protein
MGCPPRRGAETTPGDGQHLADRADSINPVDNLSAIADRSVVGEPRPSALAREALLTDYASAQVSHVRWTGSTVARRPGAVPVLAQVAQLAQRHAPRPVAAEDPQIHEDPRSTNRGWLEGVSEVVADITHHVDE